MYHRALCRKIYVNIYWNYRLWKILFWMITNEKYFFIQWNTQNQLPTIYSSIEIYQIPMKHILPLQVVFCFLTYWWLRKSKLKIINVKNEFLSPGKNIMTCKKDTMLWNNKKLGVHFWFTYHLAKMHCLYLRISIKKLEGRHV